jgi:hypothetical protein
MVSYIPSMMKMSGYNLTEFIIYSFKTHPLGFVAVFTVAQGLYTNLRDKGVLIIRSNKRFALLVLGTTIISAPFIIDASLTAYNWFKLKFGDFSDDFFHYTTGF